MFAKEKSENCQSSWINWSYVNKNMNDMRKMAGILFFEEVKSFCEKMNLVVPNMEDQIAVRGRPWCHGAKLVCYYTIFFIIDFQCCD